LCQSTKYEDFEDKIDALISLDVDNYRLITKKDRRYVFNNSDGGAHAVVRNRIIQSIV